ncbi:hypothetical protein GCM10008961_22120 [Deinococcus knuensis]|uniref:Oxidoreductase molybdopterin-binding domain-containing protein n=1 Tax=Deinococcus knuensis TaxID=1837380 RepID=A0ABQ2SIK9_9DEIO|nr:hypothetical protein GCM10008961_22120 [Deinococcus knuensis]
MPGVFPHKSHLLLYCLLLTGTLGTDGTANAEPGTPGSSDFRYVQPARPFPPARPGEPTLLTLHATRPEHLTLNQLRALPATQFTVQHPQLQQTFTYRGVPLRDLARRGGFLGRDIRVTADDGFIAIIRAADYSQAPIMVAYEADGRPIPTLKKGPLLIAFPPDRRFPPNRYGSQWAWYVTGISPRTP